MTAPPTTSPAIRKATHAELSACLASARVPILRTMRQFAEHELVIPEGQYRGTRWRPGVQPYAALLLDEIDSGRWRRFAVLGCVQGGKSLHGYILPLLYHLFEHQEPVIFAAPTIDVARDKFRNEVVPVLRAGPFGRLLPGEGSGSRGGWTEEVRFTHGPTLKAMSGHGGDEKRSSYTSRVVVITEVDKMDTAGESSREADPITQLEARMLSYDEDQRRLYMECTVSIPTGRIWREYQAGTASRIVCPCPHCRQFVCPERENLVGWQDAQSAVQAGRAAHFACPNCGKALTDDDRRAMNARAKLLHRGQTIDAGGRVTGELPDTVTLGFRFSAFNNLFWSVASIGAKEWEAAHAEDQDNADREMRQFYWAIPWEPPEWDTTPLNDRQLRTRTAADRTGKGFVPEWCEFLTAGVDIGEHVSWWVACAWKADGTGRIVDYGTIEIPSESLGVDRAIPAGLRTFRDETILGGFQSRGDRRLPDQVWVDSGHKPELVIPFCRESNASARRWLPSRGYGTQRNSAGHYHAPDRPTKTVKLIGMGYHLLYSTTHRSWIACVNADEWKSRLHRLLSVPAGRPGALDLYHSTDRNEHITLSKHLTAEKQVQEFVPGKGTVTKWVCLSRANHYLDCAYLACAAAHLCGVRFSDQAQPQPPPQQVREARAAEPRFITPGGRPFLVTER